MQRAEHPWRRAVGVVVVDILAEGVVEMSSARNENAVSALAVGAGDPPPTDRVRARCLDGRFLTIRMPVAVKTASNASVYLLSLSLIRISGRWSTRQGP